MAPTMKDLGINQARFRRPDCGLALEIWESLGDAHPPVRLTAEQRAESTRHDAELDANSGVALTWQEIRAAVESKP